jgi:hypothetical protein
MDDILDRIQIVRDEIAKANLFDDWTIWDITGISMMG